MALSTGGGGGGDTPPWRTDGGSHDRDRGDGDRARRRGRSSGDDERAPRRDRRARSCSRGRRSRSRSRSRPRSSGARRDRSRSRSRGRDPEAAAPRGALARYAASIAAGLDGDIPESGPGAAALTSGGAAAAAAAGAGSSGASAGGRGFDRGVERERRFHAPRPQPRAALLARGVPEGASDADLARALAQYGAVRGARLLPLRGGGGGGGRAVDEFASVDDAVVSVMAVAECILGGMEGVL